MRAQNLEDQGLRGPTTTGASEKPCESAEVPQPFQKVKSNVSQGLERCLYSCPLIWCFCARWDVFLLVPMFKLGDCLI